MFQLNVRGLSCQRAENILFSGISFALEGGAWLHVKGRNGAGKSTLLRTLAGLVRPASGVVTFSGRLGPAVRRVLCGHQAAVKRELSAEENLRVGIPGDSPASAAQVQAALTKVGLGKAASVPARYLSEGQKRRLVLARLLLQCADLWLLDEPVNGLDSDGVELLGLFLREHLANGGAAVVTSHQPLPVAVGKSLAL